MKSLLLLVWATVLALLVTLNVQAAEKDDGTSLHVGNQKVSFSFLYRSIEGYNMTNINANYQWFVADLFSVGPSLSYSYSDITAIGIGPAATWYFLTEKKLGAYLAEELTFRSFNTSPAASYFNSITGLGFDYFLTPNVGFGPMVSYNRGFAGSNISLSSGYWDFRVGFSIYL